MKIVGVTFTCNEKKLIPYVMPYWEKLGVDKLIVYDNDSNDGTFETLIKHPLTEVRLFNTGGEFNEYALTYLRNEGWKDIDADWIIVTDFDEVPFYTPSQGTLRDYLEKSPGTIIQTYQYNIIRENLPTIQNLDNDKILLHQIEGNLFQDPGVRYHKTHMFNPRSIATMNYVLGCHSCNPQGNVVPVTLPEEVVFFHLRYLGRDYTLELCKSRYERLPDNIKKSGGINWHYKKTLEEYDKIIEEFKAQAKPYWKEEDKDKWTCKWGKWWKTED